MTSPIGTFLCPPGYAGPTGLWSIAREASAAAEAVRLVRRGAGDRLAGRRTPYALRAPERGVHPVVLVPGFMAGDGSLSVMARHLRRTGHRTYRSRMRANMGCTQAASDALERRIEAIALKRERKVTLVGHSLGGLLARGVAARRPDLVEGLVTLGSPILAPGAAHPLLLLDLALVVRLQRVGVGSMLGADCTSGECARTSWEQCQAPLPPGVRFTSVFSRRDGIVDWRSCLDPQARTVEVRTSHLGMAFDPVVLDVVAEALAAGRQQVGQAGQQDGRPGRAARTGPEVSRRARLAAVPRVSAG